MYIAFLWRCRPSQVWWSAWNDSNTLNQCACKLFLILMAHVKSQLFWRMNSDSHKCVYCSQININMERFTWTILANIHLVYIATYGNGREAQRFCHKFFLNRECSDFVCLLLLTISCRKLVHLQWTGTAKGKDDHFACHNLMSTFEKNPSTSTCTVDHAVIVDHRLVWNFARKKQL